jgi:hypothetical protein
MSRDKNKIKKDDPYLNENNDYIFSRNEKEAIVLLLQRIAINLEMLCDLNKESNKMKENK